MYIYASYATYEMVPICAIITSSCALFQLSLSGFVFLKIANIKSNDNFRC